MTCCTLTSCSSFAASIQLWRSRLGRVLYSMANCLLLMKVRGCQAAERCVFLERVSLEEGRSGAGALWRQSRWWARAESSRAPGGSVELSDTLGLNARPPYGAELVWPTFIMQVQPSPLFSWDSTQAGSFAVPALVALFPSPLAVD